MEKRTNVEEYIANNKKWQAPLELLRSLILSTGLTETIKWMFPTYMLKGKNIVAIAAFKDYFGIWFFQGGTLKDDLKVLHNAQEGKTKAMRQWRFHSIEEIDGEALLGSIEEAIQNQKAGNIIKTVRSKKPLIIPPELQAALTDNQVLATHFETFGLSDKRDFAEYISTAKRIATKDKRMEKIIPMILQGVGLNDKYKKQ